ncbi:lipase family protein [Myxococcus llanfairpwllgwyngyllgogerychwyrndrobwllllantysiliogogogochensis]|uniref:Lipase family protein n=1 Tax=Myxococcus llanfairpwllgwyngyllgogerychwyrndrobwllllantysiliogogogochensis TaxID=2590453 RepID=A0A540WVG1_9BACT|nr:lipase family protein [Myxococcus llanfairpwllgwyngyllgogerychwyrndrobwllllantysiliogogogochensis]TQF13009.1 lipase family protein [Myxococcus llanfairpwllgwyngyllgogerychwyrndrobwllllantysiliogogogochensis]
MSIVQPIYTGGSYNIIQTVYKLSRFSGLGDSLEDTASNIAQQLGPIIDAALTSNSQQLGVWTRVWGPCVYQTDTDCSGKGRVSKVADNVMYAVHNAQSDCYVVAIAGTNGNSDTSHNWYDTDCLDNSVTNTVAFPVGITPTNSTSPSQFNVGNVSQGAARGTTNLLNMLDSKTNQSLQTFLGEKASYQSTLIFAGHSLGGSLCPTLARWLYQSIFDVKRWAALYVLPTAAPSTGDQGFVSAFTALFPPTAISGIANYGYWNQVIWNQYDVVPHGWTNLMNVQPYNVQNDVVWDYVENKSCQTLYGPLSGFLGLDANLVYGAINQKYQLLPSPNPYVRLPSQKFTPSPLPPHPGDFNDFLTTVGEQHLNAYDSFFGVSPNVAKLKVSLMPSVPGDAAATEERSAPVRSTA